MSNTVASELTLIIPLGLLLVTLGWWGWLFHRRGGGSD
jgi:hypothetical protein